MIAKFSHRCSKEQIKVFLWKKDYKDIFTLGRMLVERRERLGTEIRGENIKQKERPCTN
jgi:hypothetical protein